eukprot:CAMPEP_0173394896 /NCGR_PEP_ID=MMETSP1356-20130122/29863_1 /TAXON_ID=77927 ORGANISM="Hemiselmis virescens, Strain PCC157" /NCGR_SAMPLE_ID=MMETSP1356 /ASSEMBLY_ACC=CAM_ASM_000847 /LENGTH=51 /DNA_ID=CAMNT_0014353447 /DNA_START=110 /DNA_END=261 /DNA_ORIENTATION=+
MAAPQEFMHSWALDLLLHVCIYLVIFLASAFYAARNYRRRQDPEQHPFAKT